MAFKTFAPGVLTSSDVNTFLMRQAVITCTSSTRPASPNEGMTIYETDTDLYKVYDGSNWLDLYNFLGGAGTAWTPAVSNGWALGSGTATGTYFRVGKLATVFASIQFAADSTFAAAALVVSVPLTQKTNPTNTGTGLIRDDSTGILYLSPVRSNTTTTVRVDTIGGSGVIPQIANTSSTVPMTWATLDDVRFTMTYEVA